MMPADNATTTREMQTLTQLRADELFRRHQRDVFIRTDRMFAALLVLQWVASIAAAFWLSPKTWAGSTSSVHIHVWTAVLLGGLVTSLPVALAIWSPGRTLTRHVVAVAQMLTSSLLIHLTGGRIETHFHIFGSLAFLAFYRDWRVLITASVVVAADHFARGYLWPQSVYGVLWAPWWRSFEHVGWVVFEDIFLIHVCMQSVKEMREIAQRTAELESTNKTIEQTVVERTRQLQASETLAQRVIDDAIDAFVAMDCNGRIVQWNPQAETVFGWSRDEALGRTVAEMIIPPRYVQQHEQGLAHYLATGEGPAMNRRIELAALRRDRSEFPIEFTMSAIEGEAGCVFCAFIRDITVRKSSEDELRRAKEAAEAASRAKSDFLANMSHEIRTPMNGIIGMTDLALGTELTAQQREYIETIAGCSDSLLSLLNDILDFSKIEAGKLALDYTSFDADELLATTCKALGLQAHERKLELAYRIAPDVPRTLMGDPGRLRQIIVNLVGNAIKFTEHGEVVVQVEMESHNADHCMLHFSVRDTGIGIPEEKQSLIFNAFEQADNSTTRQYGGTGLGLAITSRLVQMMGGRIWLESQPGRGSTFHFTARFDRPEVEPPTEEHGEPCSLKGLTALVVDDNATNRQILIELLGAWGLCPTAAEDGVSAIKAFKAGMVSQKPYALVLLDAHMPRVDGFAVAEAIQRYQADHAATIMMLSSDRSAHDTHRCQELNISACLTKPIRATELRDTIVRCLAGNAAANGAEDKTAATQPRKQAGQWDGVCPPTGLKILLAEDSPVNQKVALGILERHGNRVVVAANGRAAIEALRRERFDVVLMDVQMPDVDGFAATAAIRRDEERTGRRTPIIAMTARAMKGDREQCLESGMDSYLSKPLHAKQLYAAINAALRSCDAASAGNRPGSHPVASGKPTAVAADSAACGEDSPSPQVGASPDARRGSLNNAAVDLAALRERVEYDLDLLNEMIELYFDSTPQLLSEIEHGIERRDAAAVQNSSHALKGALRSLSAQPSADIAEKIEHDARENNLSAALADLAQLHRELERLHTELRHCTKGT